MDGYRFYLEYENKTKKNKATRKKTGDHTGNVVAVCYANAYYGSDGKMCQEAVGATFDHPDSAVCGTSVSFDYVSDNCKRISEKQAREIHPNLFTYLDD